MVWHDQQLKPRLVLSTDLKVITQNTRIKGLFDIPAHHPVSMPGELTILKSFVALLYLQIWKPDEQVSQILSAFYRWDTRVISTQRSALMVVKISLACSIQLKWSLIGHIKGVKSLQTLSTSIYLKR